MSERNLELALRIRAAVQGAESVEDLQRRFDELVDELQRGEEQARDTDRSFGGLHQGVDKLSNALQTLAGLAVVQQFVEINRKAESLKNTLVALTGSEQKAAEEIEWLTQTANRLGVSVNDVSQAYISLTTSSKGTQLEGQKTRDIFEAIIGAMATMGRTGQEAEQAITAIAQMMGKGTIQAEELTGQLEEALPGASRALAAALGISVAELRKMSESGALLSSDVLPALAVQLKKTYGQGADGATTMSAQIARLQNAVTAVFTQIGQAGAFQVFKEGAITAAVGVRGLYGGLELTGTAIGALIAAIQNMDFSQFNATMSATAERLTKDVAAIAQYSDTLTPLLQKTAVGAKALADAQHQVSESSGKVGQSAKDTGGQIATLQYQYQKLSEKMERTLALLDRQASAQEAWANVAKEEAALRGDITKQLQLEVSLAEKDVATKQKQATEMARAASEAQRYADGLKKQADISPTVLKAAEDDAIAKQKQADSAAAAAVAASQQAEATKAANGVILQALGGQAESAAAARAKAEQLRAEYEQMKASGAPLDALVKKMDQVVRAEDAARIAAQGFREEQAITIEQLAQLKGKLDGSIGSQVAYNTALERFTQQQQRVSDQLERRNRLTEDARGADIAATHAAADLAEARGDEVRALELRNLAARQDMQLTKDQVGMREKEKTALEAVVAAKIQEADADGVRTAAELDAIAQAKEAVTAKENEIKATQAAITSKQADVEATQKQVDAAREAAKANQELASVWENTAQRSARMVKEQATAQKESAENAKMAGSIISSFYNNAIDSLSALSDKAVGAFKTMRGEIVPTGDELDQLQAITDKVGAAVARVPLSAGGFALFLNKITANANAVRQAFIDQARSAEQLAENLSKAGEGGAGAMQALIREAEFSKEQFNLLDDTRLDNLQNAIDSANNKLREMQDEADAAQARMLELDARLARAKGNTDEADRLDEEKKRLEEMGDVEKRLAEAREQQNQEQVRRLEEEKRKLDEVLNAEKADLENKIKAKKDNANADASPSGGRGGTTTTTYTNVPSGGGGSTINLSVNLPNAMIADRRALDELAHQLQPSLKDMARRLA